MRIFILASGMLGYEVITKLFHDVKVIGLATDSNSTALKELARTNDLPLFIGNPRAGRLKEFLDTIEAPVDLILSINYLFIIEPDIIEFPKQHCLNIHGSLLPKYRGRTPHVWAIINNESHTGITVHIIDESCDTGPIVGQRRIDIPSGATGGELLQEYKYQYPGLIREVLKKAEKGKLSPQPQDDQCATYFGRRTPNDGEINWDWQKERIRNWVRAQAMPYPGAFTFYNDDKIIIDKVSFSDIGFRFDMPNGKVLDTEPHPLVKVPNGALALTDIRNEDSLNLNNLKDKILGR